MADYTITFSPEQTLLLDKLTADKQKAETEAARLAAELEQIKSQRNEARAQNAALREQLQAAQQTQPTHLDEEAIRASERERLAKWLEAGGHDPEYLYSMTSASAANEMQGWLPGVIRRGEHNQTYYEHRAEDPAWPHGYLKQPEDYDFDVHTRVWER